jgi:hypothetical protein
VPSPHSSLARHVARPFRSRRRRAVIIALTALVVMGGAMVSSAPPASALPTATIGRQITLAASSGGFATIPAAATGFVGTRSISLDQGTYTWGYTISKTGFEDANARNIFLDKGVYDWDCAIKGTLAAYPAVNYLMTCELSPENPKLGPAFLPNNAATADNDSLKLPAGVWAWSSFLTPIDVPG